MATTNHSFGIILIIILVDGFLVRVLEHWLVLHKREFGRTGSAATTAVTMARSRCSFFSISSPLDFDLLRPFSQGLLGREPDDEVLYAGVAFPEDLTCV
jgi:hypothetical protein